MVSFPRFSSVNCFGVPPSHYELPSCLYKCRTNVFNWFFRLHEGPEESTGVPPLSRNLGTRRRWLGNFTSQSLYLSGEEPGTHCVGGWTGPRAGLDVLKKRKDLVFCLDLNSWIFQHSSHCAEKAVPVPLSIHSFISNLSDDRSTASSKTIPPLNAI